MANTEWKYLQPEKLTIDPNSHLAEDEWKFWLKTFTNFVEALLRGENTVDKLKVLTAHLSAPIYKLISEETTYVREHYNCITKFICKAKERNLRAAHACNSQTRRW